MPHHNSMTITQKGDRNETYEPTSIIRSLLRNGYDPMESKARESLTKKANGSDPAILRQFLMYRDKRNAGN